MKLHYFQHVPFENLAYIKKWATEKKIIVSRTQYFTSRQEAVPEGIDLLIILGGPMSVSDESKYPWLVQEKRIIEKALKKQIPLIGICLGAQLIAHVLGSPVYKNKAKEIGWFEVYNIPGTVPSGWDSILPDSFFAFHWHGDTFAVPKSAVHLASSQACTAQAFLYKQNVLGLQFHLESTLKAIKSLIRQCQDELTEGKYIQSKDEILKLSRQYLADSNRIMYSILNKIHNDIQQRQK